MSCIFCEIVAKRAPAQIVYQNESVTAFHDVHPRAPTHILIVPNEHIASLDDLEGDAHLASVSECLRVAKEIAARAGLRGGYRVLTNVGADAGQSVFHLHFHLMGGRKMQWPPG